MNAPMDLLQLEKKIRRETLQDGLLEIFMGLMLISSSTMLQKNGMAFPFFFFLLFGSQVIRAMKRCITDPRIGYVELPESFSTSQTADRLYIGLGVGILGIFLSTLILSGDIGNAARWYRWMPLPFGLVMALVFVAVGRWAGLARYYILGGLAAVIGGIFTILPFEWKLEGMMLACLSLGTVALIMGTVLFILFITRHPVLSKPGQGTHHSGAPDD